MCQDGHRTNSTEKIKKFREEALPIYFFLKKNPLNIDSITLSDNTTTYDAKIALSDGSVKYIEVTWPRDGELENLEAQIINIKGWIPTTHGANTTTARKALESEEDLPFVATSDEFELAKISPRIIESVKAKQKKFYPESTFLLVALHYFLAEKGKISNFLQEINRAIENKDKFNDIFLVNMMSNHFVISLRNFSD